MDDGTVVRVPAAEVAATILRQRQKLAEAKEHARLGALQRDDEQRQMAQEHGRKGGRKPKTKRDDQIRARVAELKRIRRTLNARERYEDVGAEFGLSWSAVRDIVNPKKTPKG
jgi:IS5 family transposase